MRVQIIILTTLLAFSASAQDVQFSTIEFPGNVIRSDITGEVGGRFFNTSGTTVTITQLGRWVRSGNSQEHTITIYDYETSEALGSVVVDCGAAPPNDFVWGTLPSPVVVPIGKHVAILSSEAAGGDSWHNAYGNPSAGLPVAQVAPYLEDVGVLDSAWRSTGNPITYSGGYSLTYGPISFKLSSPVPEWTKDGTTYTTDGDTYQIKSALLDASSGDTVTIPAGTYSWGVGGTSITIPAGVTLQGAGSGSTVINMSTASPTGYGSALVWLAADSTLKGMTFNGPDTNNCPLINTGSANDWRITDIVYTQYTGRASYFVNIVNGTRGLIDNCSIMGGAGNSELVFMRGPTNAWDADHTIGGADNVFIEDCTFSGSGYVCDANSNARMVVRNCTITGGIKVDGHGVWSNSPANSVRNMEVYRNIWTVTTGTWTAIEIRGGGGMVFDNIANAASGSNTAWFFLTEYGVFNNNGAFTPNYQTAYDYPIRDQIGRGKYSTPGDWTTATSEPMYLWNNVKGGADWPFSYKTISQASIDRYQTQTGDGEATFGWEDVIQADRDYFKHTVGGSFDGSSGVGRGTASAMNAITPSETGVGFWVTDEGEWDSTNGATPDGRLYRWNGSAWELHYTPYQYPHPLRSGVATPDDPSGLGATAVSSSQINLAWTDNSADETGFKIERSLSSGSGYTQIYVAAAAAESYSATGLDAGTTYYFRVRAYNAGGDSGYTAEASDTTDAEAPSGPTPFDRQLISFGGL